MSLTKRDQYCQQTSRTEENIAKIRQIVRENCWLTVRSIAEQVNIDRETVRKILRSRHEEECAKMVPKELTEEQNKEESQFAKIFWKGKMTFWAVSSQVMKHESTNMTLKRSSKVHNGRLPIPMTKKIPSDQINCQDNVPDFFFYNIQGLFIMNLYQLDSQPSLLFGSTGKAA